MSELLNMGVIPIVNENDTLAVSEIKFGDNDTLSAITAAMVSADYLFLMTDVDCLFTDNPRTHPDAKPIEVVADISKLEADISGPGSSVGTGGMFTKIIAAKLATSAGVTTIITRGSAPSNIPKIVSALGTPNSSVICSGKGQSESRASLTDNALAMATSLPINECAANNSRIPLHTRFLAYETPVRDRHIWLLHGLHTDGKIFVDAGAHRALTRSNKAGLLPAGILAVEGNFGSHQAVSIHVRGLGMDREVGKALVNYSAVEVDRIKGRHSDEIESLLGYSDTEYVAHRDNLAFFLSG